MKGKSQPGVYRAGALDWKCDISCILSGTYNVYLIIDERIALVDAVKHGFYRRDDQQDKEDCLGRWNLNEKLN